jgi:hypothetical protein
MNESLLPTRPVLLGTEVLRGVGPDGSPLRVPVAAVLDAAEARFATNAKIAALWQEVSALVDRLKALEDCYDELPVPTGADLQPEIAALTARVTLLEAEIKTKKDK